MKTIVLASANPVKVRATLEGFRRMFPGEEFRVETKPAASGVRDQPASDEETLRGALNRAANAADNTPEADYWVGIEAGVEEHGTELATFAWVVVRGQGRTGKARTGCFFLPERLAELVRQGLELGDADDVVFNQSNSKQANGAVGLLTGNVLDRTTVYVQAVILALIPFKNPALY